MKWLCPLVLGFILFACGNQQEDSEYADLLSAPPYSRLTDSISKFPKNDELYFRRAVLLNKNNQPEPALVDFQKAWSLAKHENYALGVSNVLLDTRPDSAVSFLKEALVVLPQSMFLQLILARAYNAKESLDDALKVCNSILATEPNQVNALLLKADIQEKKSDIAGMIESLERAHLLIPQNLEISNRLAYQYAETKNIKALTLADTLIKMDSLQLHPEAYYIKGNYYSNIGDKQKSIQFFDETIRHDHRFLNAYIEKGKALMDLHKIPEALKTFQLANTINPAFADAWYWMGRCQEAVGDKENARDNYEKAYGLDKTFSEAKEAADKLK